MNTRYLSFLLIVLIASAPAATAFAGATPDQKCASAKMKAAGKKYAAKAKCHAKALAKSLPVDGACLSLAESKFAAAFAKADARGGCLHENDADAIEIKIDTCLGDVVGDIGCGNGLLEGDEECDDGNTIAGDGCSESCLIEDPCATNGQTCLVGSDCCSGLCGDGVCQAVCGVVGTDCTMGSDCCSGICTGSVCQAPCAPDGKTCLLDSDCCSLNCVANVCTP